MISKHFLKVQKPVKFLFLFGAVVLLSYCTNSNKVASSFGKRKYTKGHFSDPIVTQKTDYNLFDNNTVASASPAQKADVKNNTFEKAPVADAQTALSTPAKSNGIAISKAPAATTTGNNLSLKENTPLPDHGGYQDPHDYDHHAGRASSLLLAWILCLAAGFVCILLVVADATAIAGGTASGGLGAGCLLYVLGSFFFIAAIVLFILWIIAIAG